MEAVCWLLDVSGATWTVKLLCSTGQVLLRTSTLDQLSIELLGSVSELWTSQLWPGYLISILASCEHPCHLTAVSRYRGALLNLTVLGISGAKQRSRSLQLH